jgi:hypothetical protein
MKKTHIFDAVLCFSCLVAFLYNLRWIESPWIATVSVAYLVGTGYTSLKLKIIHIYPPENKISIREIFNVVWLVWGRAYFLLMMASLNQLSGEAVPQMLMLPVFTVYAMSLLGYTYFYEDKLIKASGKTILVKDIASLEVDRKAADQVAIRIRLGDGKNKNLIMSKYDYESLSCSLKRLEV